MKLSQKMYDAIGEQGWPPWKVARFLKRANRIAMKMMREAELHEQLKVTPADGEQPKKVTLDLSPESPLTTKSKAFKEAVTGMKLAIEAAEHMTKIAVLVEATLPEKAATAEEHTIHIHPTPAAKERLDGD